MQLLSVSKLSKTIGDRTLFKDVDFGISEGEKLAIVGVNGSGKSTLLRILTGKEESDTGEIVKNRELKTSILAQNFHSDPEKTVREHIFRGEGKTILLLKKYSDICERMAEGDANAEKEYNAILTEMDKVSAWEYETQVESILRELGIDHLNLKMSDLSGGMLKKVELASALIEESNLLILDEPTNHLDVQSILWLEDFLVQTQKALILITHDRYFLDRITDKILEIDSGKCFLYQGNYSYFLEKKAEREEKERIQEEKAEKFLRKEIEWLRRQPKARTTKQKARIDRADAVINREKYEIQKELELSVAAKRQGKTIMEVKNIRKSFGEKTI
ncbi:MAG TPA: ATP-binding cassette domain-containing protein, partial [Leptospiraceae bacterium]|nr:ATP-binding cassette domain-containing protein [Leptospiraceae bacterium]